MLPRINEAVANLATELEHIQGDNQRLQKNRMMILWALKQFLFFTQESGAVTKHEADKMFEKAVKICDDILDEQIRQITSLEPAKNLSYYILYGLQQDIIQRVSEKKVKKNKQLPEYYYVHIKDDDPLLVTLTGFEKFLMAVDSLAGRLGEG